MDQNISDTSASETQPEIKKDEISFLLYAFILKKLSDIDHPINAVAINSYMSTLTGLEFSANRSKTILRNLKDLCTEQNQLSKTPEFSHLIDVISEVMGGKIVHFLFPNGAAKPHHLFYFEPLIKKSDLDMINGSISSSRYLSDAETQYLLSRLSILNSFIGEDHITKKLEDQYIPSNTLLPKPKASCKPGSLPVDNSDQLSNIQTLYQAISEKHQVDVVYGNYAPSKKDFRKISFQPRNPEHPYRLNPYALLWNNGQYYLLATFSGHDNVIHFRVDRIVSAVRIRTDREAMPSALKPYFQEKTKQQEIFLADKYRADYPLMMSSFEGLDPIDAILECTTNTLSILIDTFGPDLEVLPSTVPHDPNELDYNHKKPEFLVVRVSQVQYKSLLLFCLQQQASVADPYPLVFALSPERLVDDIAEHLQQSLARYQQLQKNASTIPHPFIHNKTL